MKPGNPVRTLPPRPAAALLAVLLLVPMLFLGRLHINNAPATYFPSDSPAVTAEARLRERFPEDDLLFVLFQGRDLYSTSFLRTLDDLTLGLQAHPLVERVFALTNMEHIGGRDDTLVIERLVDPRSLDRESAGERRRRVLADRFAPDWLASRDGGYLALAVRPPELTDSFGFLHLFETVQARIRDHGLGNRVAAYAGTVALNVAQFRSMLRDSLLFIPANLVVGLALVWWLFRNGRMLLLSALTMLTVATATVALHIVADRPYTLVSAITPPFMTALSTALLLHLFNALWYTAARGHRGRAQIDRALAAVRRPAWYNTITTAAALASLAFSPVQPVRTFGLTTATGMLVLYFVAMILLPPLLVPLDGTQGHRRSAIRRLDRAMTHITALGLRHAGKVVLGATLLTLAALAAALRVEVETDLYRFFPADHWLSRATQTIQDKLTGMVPLEVVFTTTAANGLLDPANLHAIRDFQRWVETLPGVDRSLSMAELIEELHWAFHGEAGEYRRIPESRALIHQYLFIYNGRDLYELADTDLRMGRVLLNLRIHGANTIQAVMERIDGHLRRAPPAGLQWQIAGLGRLFADEEDLLLDGLNRSSVIAAGMIFLLLALLWRSWSAASLCMLPNLAPVVLIFGLMAVLGIWLDVATAMIASVAVGIAVDDTIHIFHGYHNRRTAGASPVWAAVRTLRRTGRAVSATTLILCVQFLILTASEFHPTMEFGLLTAVGLATALGFDLLFLPALLMLIEQRRRRPAQP